WPILDDELLAQSLREPLSDQACYDVSRATGGKAGDQTHGACRIRLRPCLARDHRQGSSICRQTQKSTASNVHDFRYSTLLKDKVYTECGHVGRATRVWR